MGRWDMLNVTVSGQDRVEPLCDIAHAGGQAALSRDWEVSTAVEGDSMPEAVASIRSRGVPLCDVPRAAGQAVRSRG